MRDIKIYSLELKSTIDNYKKGIYLFSNLKNITDTLPEHVIGLKIYQLWTHKVSIDNPFENEYCIIRKMQVNPPAEDFKSE